MDRWRVEIKLKTDKHEKTLYGNGDPGLDEEIRNIKSMLNVLIRLAWIVVTVAVGVFITGFISAAAYLVKVMP